MVHLVWRRQLTTWFASSLTLLRPRTGPRTPQPHTGISCHREEAEYDRVEYAALPLCRQSANRTTHRLGAAHGHDNKFLGDGALAVFGAPNDVAENADAAVNPAALIHRRFAERFQGELSGKES